MQLAYERAIPVPAILHRVEEDAVGVNLVNPHIGLSPAVSVTDFLKTDARDKELLEGAAVELLQAVMLVGILHGSTHQLAQTLFLPVARHTHRLSLVVAELPQHRLDHLANEVILQRHLALLADILLLGHHPPVGQFYPVVPLPAISIVPVSFSFEPEVIDLLPGLLRLQQHRVVGPFYLAARFAPAVFPRRRGFVRMICHIRSCFLVRCKEKHDVPPVYGIVIQKALFHLFIRHTSEISHGISKKG